MSWRRVARWRGARRRARGSPLRVGQRGPVTVTHAHRRPLRPTRGLPSQVTTEIPILTGGNRPGRPAAGPPGRGATSDASGTAAHAGPGRSGRPGVRACRALPRNRALLSLASAAEARRQQAPFSMRPSEKTRPPAVAALASRAARSPAALLFAARHVPLPGGQHRPGRGRSAPSRGAAAPPSARPRDCSAASRPAAVSRAVFSPHTSELARQHRIHLTFKITESGHDAPARKLRTLPARQCGVRTPGVGGCH